jgi:pimeloyl-ACP methyl ester carboxylesterase
MPVIILLIVLVELFTVGLIILDIHLIREWYIWKDTIDDEYARRCLYGAIALTAWSFFGRTIISSILSKARKNEDKPRQEHSKESEQLKRPDGSVINIEFMGDKKFTPIVFVHGWNENSTAWYYEKKKFSQSNYVILIDLPGLGKSKRPVNKDFSLQKMAADLEAVIEHLRFSKAVLWGHSIGGMIILTYCCHISKNLGQRVKGIILQHTTFTNPTHTSIASRLLMLIEKPVLYPICYIMIALSPLFWLSKWMSYMNGNLLISTRFLVFAGTQTPAQLDFVSRLSAMAPPSVFARGMLGMMKTYDVSNDLQKVTVPALIIGANSDKLTKPVASEHMNKNIPNSELVILYPAGHQGQIERHRETNEAAERFINGLR